LLKQQKAINAKLVLIKTVTAMMRDRCWVWSRNFELKKRVKDANTIKLLHTQDGVSDLYIEKICLKKATFRKKLTAGKEA
jgi:hypothetical protein